MWARVCIFVSGLMKLKPENLYLNTNMSIEALPLHNSIGPAMVYLFQETSSLVHALAKTNPCKASPCTRGAKHWEQISHTTWLHFIGNLHHVNIIMNFGRIYFKAQKSPYLQKWCRSPWSKTDGNIISSWPIVQAHGTTSHFLLMIQAHESHRVNFRNRDLEVQEVCSVKL